MECDQTVPQCRTCIVKDHQNLWYHWVQRWNGKYHTRHALGDLGLVVYLGHHGVRCPDASDNSTPANFVIGHTNGLHRCKVVYCHCPDRLAVTSQLVRSRIFPATRSSPHSSFTIDLLQMWHTLWLTAKISTHDFLRTLARLTDSAFPSNVKVSKPVTRSCEPPSCCGRIAIESSAS